MNDWWPSALDSTKASMQLRDAKAGREETLGCFPHSKAFFSNSKDDLNLWVWAGFCVLSFNVAASPLSTDSHGSILQCALPLEGYGNRPGVPHVLRSYLGNTAWPLFVPLTFNLGFHFCTCVRDRWCPWLGSQMAEWIEIFTMFILKILCVCVRTRACMLCDIAHMWRSEAKLWKSVLFFYHVGPGQT